MGLDTRVANVGSLAQYYTALGPRFGDAIVLP